MKKLLISVLLLTATAVQAQKNDPVIMKVAGVDVPRSEFEYSYNKNNTDGVIDKKTVEEYVDLFVNYKLKVQAALDARIDTTTAFLNEFAQYRDQQIRPTFVTDDDMLAEAHNVYDQTVKNIGPDGLVQASHILILIPQKATEAQQQDAKRRIDSVYTALKAGADFEALAKQVSQDPGSAQRGGMLGWFSRNQMVKEFEDVAFSLQPGEMSAPFLSSFGWHIILQKDRKQFEPFDFHRENILKYLEQRNARNYITEHTLFKLHPSLRQQYDKFIDEGSLIVMPGTVLDMIDVYEDLVKCIDDNQYDVRCFGYDPYNAKDFVERWAKENSPYGIEKVIQGARTESVPLGELKKLAEERLLLFDEELMKFAMGNCITLEDTNGNRKLYKRRHEQKIDAVAAMMDAYVAYKLNREAFE